MEDYPRSSPASSSSASAGPTTIKVSLDETVIIDRRSNAELMTDGLSGCVAVALKSGDRIGLTHVYSDALGRFDDYKAPLAAFAREVANGGEITEAYFVHNNNVRRQGEAHNLPELIQNHLADNGAVKRSAMLELTDNGCSISDRGLHLKHRDNPTIYAPGGHTNSLLERIDEGLAARIAPTARGDLFAHVPARADMRASGFDGPCELQAVPVASHAHNPDAFQRPRAPPKPAIDHTSLPLGESVRVQAAALEIFKFSDIRPAARVMTAAIEAQGIGRATLEASPDKLHILASGDGKTVAFDVEGGKVNLSAPTGPVASSSTPSPTLSLPTLSLPTSSLPSASTADTRPKTLYEQAADALSPHRESLKLSDPDRFSEAARTVASQANRDGLADIARVEVLGIEHGKSMLVAHQSGAEPKQSQPTAVEGAPQHGGATPRSPSQDGPDKNHFPIM